MSSWVMVADALIAAFARKPKFSVCRKAISLPQNRSKNLPHQLHVLRAASSRQRIVISLPPLHWHSALQSY
jgi:hypothetical protein